MVLNSRQDFNSHQQLVEKASYKSGQLVKNQTNMHGSNIQGHKIKKTIQTQSL